jgi:citrate lyase subunit beta/citryl-CoA lyase
MDRPIRRSEMTCPGHSLKMMQKAAASDADEVIFDLEDACAMSQKVEARQAVAHALARCDFTGGKVRAYRINGVETPWCYRDVIDVLEASAKFVDVVVVPKVRTADDVKFVDRLITQIELAQKLPLGRIRLEVLIETSKALLQAEAIATSSPRLDSLIFGVADFAGEVGARDFKENQQQVFSYARQHLLTAARAAGLDAIDSVTVQFKDLSQVEADARHAAMLGYDGKWAIHPAQLPAIHAAFTPNDVELARAQRIIDAYALADATAGLGAIVIDGEMVDAATLMVEKRKLAIAQKIAR